MTEVTYLNLSEGNLFILKHPPLKLYYYANHQGGGQLHTFDGNLRRTSQRLGGLIPAALYTMPGMPWPRLSALRCLLRCRGKSLLLVFCFLKFFVNHYLKFPTIA
jgi:hypothetical protein